MSSVKFTKDSKIDCSCHFSENSSLVGQLTFRTYELVPFFNGQIYYDVWRLAIWHGPDVCRL